MSRASSTVEKINMILMSSTALSSGTLDAVIKMEAVAQAQVRQWLQWWGSNDQRKWTPIERAGGIG